MGRACWPHRTRRAPAVTFSPACVRRCASARRQTRWSTSARRTPHQRETPQDRRPRCAVLAPGALEASRDGDGDGDKQLLTGRQDGFAGGRPGNPTPGAGPGDRHSVDGHALQRSDHRWGVSSALGTAATVGRALTPDPPAASTADRRNRRYGRMRNEQARGRRPSGTCARQCSTLRPDSPVSGPALVAETRDRPVANGRIRRGRGG